MPHEEGDQQPMEPPPNDEGLFMDPFQENPCEPSMHEELFGVDPIVELGDDLGPSGGIR